MKVLVIGGAGYIGSHVVITEGVSIGDDARISVGSIVTKDVPANTIAAGTPCKVIKERR